MITDVKTNKNPKAKWVAIKTGAGVVTGYLEVFRGRGGKYVSVPGASRFRTVKCESSKANAGL